MQTNSWQDDFPPTNKQEWWQQIANDNKGRTADDLAWQLEDNIRLALAYTAEDFVDNSLPASPLALKRGWQVGEYVRVTDVAKANAELLEGLNGGIQAPLFQLFHLPTVEELDVLLSQVEHTFISLHFAPNHPGKDPAELFRNLIYLARRRGAALSGISGSMDFDPMLDWTDPPFQPLARIIRFAHAHTPAFKVLQVNGSPFHDGAAYSSRELALTIAKAQGYLSSMEAQGVPVEVTNAHLQFSVNIGRSYFVEIAKLRALRILWANVLHAHGLDASQQMPPIAVHLSPESQDDNEPYNMISATTQAMSAVIGGADFLYLPPANAVKEEESTSFTRRIARNIQHLLQMESHLDEVADPAAGSYYLEMLTRELAEKAWAQVQHIEEKGGFLELDGLD